MPTPNDAMDYAKRFIGNLPLDDSLIKLRILDDAHNKLWMASPWRWTLTALEAVTLANDTQDYNLASITDILYIQSSRYTLGSEEFPLTVHAALPVTTAIKGNPSQVQFVTGTPQKLRVFPVVTAMTTLPVLFSVYKKTATPIDATNSAAVYSNLGIPNEWFWVYQEIVLLKAYQFTQSQKTGNVEVVGNRISYTGQFAAVAAAIEEMRQSEKKFLDSVGREEK